MAYECLLEVMLLDGEQQAELTRGVELPFVPSPDMLLNGLDERLAYDEDSPSLCVDRVIWDHDKQLFHVDCGVVDLEDEAIADALTRWADWSVDDIGPREVPAWATEEPVDLLGGNPDNEPGYQWVQGSVRLVGEPREGAAEGDPLHYHLEAGLDVVCADGLPRRADSVIADDLWLFDTPDEAAAAMRLYHRLKSDRPGTTRRVE